MQQKSVQTDTGLKSWGGGDFWLWGGYKALHKAPYAVLVASLNPVIVFKVEVAHAAR